MFLGIFTTLCIPETKRITLEVLSGEESASSALAFAENGLKDEVGKKKNIDASSF
jgi:PHS family inorganic phosphate transporter-like MFS transporter